ncbi:hypothetical protein LRS05_03170 [Flavobacterium sp. J372]|uniref:GTP pyrophosphokinase n=1 Tax=Flavobacterium sp. J372 TaxID=2898436 RepID=UPI0021511614|nr:hypothetical protein [Flavobacterium sp. J372]MCR5861205.1 hypothetical protein [Flavobacterium sp. J372]
MLSQAELKLEVDKHVIFTNLLHQLLTSLLNSSGIKYHVIECRTKTLDSLSEKTERKEIQNLSDITDISGLRIILYYQDDVDKVVDMIKSNFVIDDKNSINKADLYSSNEFGYLSLHYIVSINKKRNILPEWALYKSLKSEIQIRTVLQHSWASISHELSYKKQYDIPKELQRKLFRLAGLFELADEQFLKIRDEHESLKTHIENVGQADKIENEKINLLTISYVFQPGKKLGIFKDIEYIALTSGFSDSTESDIDVKDEQYSEIITLSKILGLSTIGELENKLQIVKPKLENFFTELINQKSGRNWYGDITFFVSLALLYLLNSEQLELYKKQANHWSKMLFERVAKTVEKLKG